MKKWHTGSHKPFQTEGGGGKPSFLLLPDSTLLPFISCRGREQRCTSSTQQDAEAWWAIMLCIPWKAVSSASALHWHFPPNSPNLLLRHCCLSLQSPGATCKRLLVPPGTPITPAKTHRADFVKCTREFANFSIHLHRAVLSPRLAGARRGSVRRGRPLRTKSSDSPQFAALQQKNPHPAPP